MGLDALIALCKQLAQSQGFYGRLLSKLQNASDSELKALNGEMLKHNFKDQIDIILWLEG